MSRPTHDFPHLDRPIELGGVTARNRIMMSTHGPRLSQPRYLRYLDERAQGGIGLAGFNLGPLGLMQFPFGPGLASAPHGDLDAVPPHPLTIDGRAYYDSLIPHFREWSEAVARHGVVPVGQLYHPGAAQHSDNLQPVVAASAVVDDYERHRPHVLSGSDIGDLIQAYALSARRGVAAGFACLEIHAAHGYLVQQFLSPLLNRRGDEWGGSVDNRLRFLIAVIGAVRDAVGGEVPVGIRLTGPEPDGGLAIDDIVLVAQRAEAAGAAYVSLSGGTYSGLWRGANQAYVASALTAPGPNVAAAAAVRHGVGIPVMVGGSIVGMAQAEAIVAAGDADIVCMVRALIADPRLVAKGFAGDGAARPCIGGNECHYGKPVACAVNPATGREAQMQPVAAAQPKRVLIVGGGPAGMECALAAANRGHEVMLVEREPRLGGMLATLSTASEQARFGDYVDYTAGKIGARRIAVHLGVVADRRWIARHEPDTIVVATGALARPAFGIDAATALRHPERLGRRIVVAAGKDDHLGPLVTADFLARRGHQVTLVTETASPGQAVEPASLYALLRRLQEHDVVVLPFRGVTGFTDRRVETMHMLTGTRGAQLDADDLIDVDGRTADAATVAQLTGISAQLHVIGDALSPRRMLHATLDGARLGLQI